MSSMLLKLIDENTQMERELRTLRYLHANLRRMYEELVVAYQAKGGPMPTAMEKLTAEYRLDRKLQRQRSAAAEHYHAVRVALFRPVHDFLAELIHASVWVYLAGSPWPLAMMCGLTEDEARLTIRLLTDGVRPLEYECIRYYVDGEGALMAERQTRAMNREQVNEFIKVFETPDDMIADVIQRLIPIWNNPPDLPEDADGEAPAAP